MRVEHTHYPAMSPRLCALQKSTTLAVSFARSVLDSVVGNVPTFVSISAVLRRRIISKANLFQPTSVDRSYV